MTASYGPEVPLDVSTSNQNCTYNALNNLNLDPHDLSAALFAATGRQYDPDTLVAFTRYIHNYSETCPSFLTGTRLGRG